MFKVIENVMVHHLTKHSDYLLPKKQLGYCPKLSCKTDLLKLTNEIMIGMEQKLVTPCKIYL